MDEVFEEFFKQPHSLPEFLAIDSCHLLLSIQQSSNISDKGSNSHNGNQQTIFIGHVVVGPLSILHSYHAGIKYLYST